MNMNKEYMKIDLQQLYENFQGFEKWLIISDLSTSELLEKFQCLQSCKPFVLLTYDEWAEISKTIQHYTRNESKHKMRRMRHHSLFDYVPGETECYINLQDEVTPERLYLTNENNQELDDLLKDHLSSRQYRRARLLLAGYTEVQIAQMEGVKQSAISQCKSTIIKKLKKLF